MGDIWKRQRVNFFNRDTLTSSLLSLLALCSSQEGCYDMNWISIPVFIYTLRCGTSCHTMTILYYLLNYISCINDLSLSISENILTLCVGVIFYKILYKNKYSIKLFCSSLIKLYYVYISLQLLKYHWICLPNLWKIFERYSEFAWSTKQAN